jgi:hypothetical protein
LGCAKTDFQGKTGGKSSASSDTTRNSPNSPEAPGGSNPTTSDTPDTDPSKILREDGGTVDLPGVRTKSVRVNFEDTDGKRAKDLTAKDVFVCFAGDFKFSDRKFVTASKQDVKFKAGFQGSPCLHHTIKISAVDHSSNLPIGESKSFDSRVVTEFSLSLPINARIQASFIVTNPMNCSAAPAGTRTLEDDPRFVEILNIPCT